MTCSSMSYAGLDPDNIKLGPLKNHPDFQKSDLVEFFPYTVERRGLNSKLLSNTSEGGEKHKHHIYNDDSSYIDKFRDGYKRLQHQATLELSAASTMNLLVQFHPERISEKGDLLAEKYNSEVKARAVELQKFSDELSKIADTPENSTLAREYMRYIVLGEKRGRGTTNSKNAMTEKEYMALELRLKEIHKKYHVIYNYDEFEASLANLIILADIQIEDLQYNMTRLKMSLENNFEIYQTLASMNKQKANLLDIYKNRAQLSTHDYQQVMHDYNDSLLAHLKSLKGSDIVVIMNQADKSK